MMQSDLVAEMVRLEQARRVRDAERVRVVRRRRGVVESEGGA